MRRFVAGLIGVLLQACTQQPSGGALVHRQVSQKNPGGKDLEMVFREVRRDDRTSLAKVTYRSGASVPSAVFVMCGFSDTAKARRAQYFINLKEWDGPDGDRMYLIGFSNERNISIPEYFQFTERPSVPDRHELLSVDQFSRICR